MSIQLNGNNKCISCSTHFQSNSNDNSPVLIHYDLNFPEDVSKGHFLCHKCYCLNDVTSLCLLCFRVIDTHKLYLEYPNLNHSIDAYKGCLDNSNMINSRRQHSHLSQKYQKYKLKYLKLKNLSQ